jgi:hypothetical protein
LGSSVMVPRSCSRRLHKVSTVNCHFVLCEDEAMQKGRKNNDCVKYFTLVRE